MCEQRSACNTTATQRGSSVCVFEPHTAELVFSAVGAHVHWLMYARACGRNVQHRKGRLPSSLPAAACRARPACRYRTVGRIHVCALLPRPRVRIRRPAVLAEGAPIGDALRHRVEPPSPREPQPRP
eukprot:24574-Chlamydomonas_euryale.AAC.2